MLFNSWQFIFLYIPVTFFVYFFLNKIRLLIAGKVWLVTASLFFYAYWDAKYLPLILCSILFNFAIGTGLTQSHNELTQTRKKKSSNRKIVLLIGIFANIFLLGYFKYTDFLLSNINFIFGENYNLHHIVLPLAISFFTFTQIAYLVDSYRGETSEYDLLSYSLFVTFFPHLIAGPIVHHRHIMPQFVSRWAVFQKTSNIQKGLFIFAIGLFKKVVIADSFSLYADYGFDGGAALNLFSAWATSLSYTFQIYFDFSGYCDMAIGSSLLFNIWLPINFNSPYKALNIQDFWRRWHITLSYFLRDYLYIPLGGNRCSQPRIYLNLFITFVLGGLWHGATWLFVIWGAMHGVALIVNRIWKGFQFTMPSYLAWLLTFTFVNTSWVFFRAKTLDDAIRILKGMMDIRSVIWSSSTSDLAWAGWMSDILLKIFPASFIGQLPIFMFISFAFIILSYSNSVEMLNENIGLNKMMYGAIIFSAAIYFMLSSTSTVFLYFNF